MVYKKRKSWFFCFEIRKMYKEAASLGIDLMGYDSNDSAIKRRNRRKAVVLLGTGQSVPEKKND